MAIKNQNIASKFYMAMATCTAMGLPHETAELIACQSRHESGNYSSVLFTDDHNSFGMKVPSIRKSPYIIGTSREGAVANGAPKSEGVTPYARYASMADSVKDLIHWLRFNHADFTILKTPEAYARFLKQKGYFGDAEQHYVDALKRYLNELHG